MSVDLTGKVAVITGGGSGLGAAMGSAFAAAGAAVAVLDIDGAAADTTAGRIADEASVATTALQVDVGDAASVAAAPAHVASTLARPAQLAATGAREEDLEEMLAHRPVGEADVVMPEHAIRHLLDDLAADEPYSITHGTVRDDYLERHEAMLAAIDRMGRA